MALDLHARRVIGWAFSVKPDAELVIKALDMAYEQRDKPQQVLFHFNQGSQYASRLFRQRLWRYRMEQSMSRRGNCWGQLTDGTVVPESEVGVGSADRLSSSLGGAAGHQPLPDASLQLGQAASIQRRAAARCCRRKT